MYTILLLNKLRMKVRVRRGAGAIRIWHLRLDIVHQAISFILTGVIREVRPGSLYNRAYNRAYIGMYSPYSPYSLTARVRDNRYL